MRLPIVSSRLLRCYFLQVFPLLCTTGPTGVSSFMHLDVRKTNGA